MDDEFVFKDLRIHTFLRGLAAFVVAPILTLKGMRQNDSILIIIGVGTFIIDLVTFMRSFRRTNA